MRTCVDVGRYTLAVEGVANTEEARGVINTLPSRPHALNVVAVADDSPSLLGYAPSGWTKLAKMMEVPFHGVDAVVHVGGQAVSKRHIQESVLWCRVLAYETRLQQRQPACCGTVRDVEPATSWVGRDQLHLSLAAPSAVRCLQQQDGTVPLTPPPIPDVVPIPNAIDAVGAAPPTGAEGVAGGTRQRGSGAASVVALASGEDSKAGEESKAPVHGVSGVGGSSLPTATATNHQPAPRPATPRPQQLPDIEYLKAVTPDTYKFFYSFGGSGMGGEHLPPDLLPSERSLLAEAGGLTVVRLLRQCMGMVPTTSFNNAPLTVLAARVADASDAGLKSWASATGAGVDHAVDVVQYGNGGNAQRRHRAKLLPPLPPEEEAKLAERRRQPEFMFKHRQWFEDLSYVDGDGVDVAVCVPLGRRLIRRCIRELMAESYRTVWRRPLKRKV